MATVTIPSNENGLILDPEINAVIAEAVQTDPFGFEDVVIYSHGWSTDADGALDDYDIFSIGLSRRLLTAQRLGTHVFPNPPLPSLEIGIHWPSEITEDPNSPLNDLQLFTFYTMEHRADAVGKNLVYSLLRIVLEARASGTGIRFLLLGHSFGCKVVCAALQEIQGDIERGTKFDTTNVRWRVVLLEPATDFNNLDPGDIYGAICRIDNLRLLMTKSNLDRALTDWFPAASRLANLFHGAQPTPALGAEGPSNETIAAFGGAQRVSVNVDFDFNDILTVTERLVVADLTLVHAARLQSVPPLYSGSIFAGSHSDIKFDQLYNLVGGFLFA